MIADIPPAKRARRSSTNTKQNYDEDFLPFLVSDDEGSDFSEDAESDSEEEAKEYDAAATNVQFDLKRGEDNWIGRRVCKVFPDHGEFEGVIYGVDVDDNNTDYRLFLVHYFEDPDDGESMWPQEIARLVVFLVIERRFMCCAYTIF